MKARTYGSIGNIAGLVRSGADFISEFSKKIEQSAISKEKVISQNLNKEKDVEKEVRKEDAGDRDL